ncbi:hypothetical protein AB0J63_45125 [Streptosporangium canum]|uniref:hypothetical protein n=1 Tax=Streptosporangium canum TaxID=324952 RepID=UPI00341B183E
MSDLTLLEGVPVANGGNPTDLGLACGFSRSAVLADHLRYGLEWELRGGMSFEWGRLLGGVEGPFDQLRCAGAEVPLGGVDGVQLLGLTSPHENALALARLRAEGRELLLTAPRLIDTLPPEVPRPPKLMRITEFLRMDLATD